MGKTARWSCLSIKGDRCALIVDFRGKVKNEREEDWFIWGDSMEGEATLRSKRMATQ